LFSNVFVKTTVSTSPTTSSTIKLEQIDPSLPESHLLRCGAEFFPSKSAAQTPDWDTRTYTSDGHFSSIELIALVKEAAVTIWGEEARILETISSCVAHVAAYVLGGGEEDERRGVFEGARCNGTEGECPEA
jgi:hypothetical protein